MSSIQGSTIKKNNYSNLLTQNRNQGPRSGNERCVRRVPVVIATTRNLSGGSRIWPTREGCVVDG